MGAEAYVNTTWTDKSMKDAFQEVREWAQHDYGHGGYTGTIAEACGMNMDTAAPKPMPVDEAMDYAEDRASDMDKWGPGRAIQVCWVDEATFAKIGEVKFRIEVDTKTLSDQDALKAEVAKALTRGDVAFATTMPAGKTLPKRFTAKNLRHVSTVYGTAETTVKTKTVSTKGKTETRYFIIQSNATNQPMPTWEKGHTSLAEARKNLPKALVAVNHNDAYRGADTHQEFEIVSMTRRVGGEGMVKHTVTASKTSVVMRADVVIQTSARKVNPKKTGWLFYGMASS